MKISLTISLIILSFSLAYSQQQLEKKLSGEYNPLELVSISQYAGFDQAVKMLSAVSELVTGKSIVSIVEDTSPIGVEIKKMPYIDALNLIVNSRNLMYEEKEGSIVIKPKGHQQDDQDVDTYADIDAREVNISAVFFDADIQAARDLGIDWRVLFSQNGVNLGANLRTRIQPTDQQLQNQALQPEFNASSLSQFTSGNWTGNATAIFRFFEQENLGEVIASPSITVRDKQKGRIQIGSDFSVAQRDFSGNTIQQFYSTGAIIEVTPYVYNKNGIDYVLLKLMVERSDFFPSELTTEIKKQTASSDVLLLDGEETVIGGLYINQETVVRNGIPFLKDLPWWVFGIRYLTGSDQTVIKKKEVIILLRAELLETLETRFVNKTEKNLIKDKLKENQERIDLFKQGTTEEKVKYEK